MKKRMNYFIGKLIIREHGVIALKEFGSTDIWRGDYEYETRVMQRFSIKV